MTPSEAIRLLIIDGSRDETERLISLLQATGRPFEPHLADSEDVLSKLLQELNFQLLIGDLSAKKLPASAAIKQIARLNQDIPVILRYDNDTSGAPVVEGLRLGAADVVNVDADQHLLLVIERELAHQRNRQAKRLAERRVYETERRNQDLLDSSRDAIAYMQDGLFVYVNQSFADMFEYSQTDDILAQPIMDIVASEDRERIKQLFKDLSGDSDTHTFQFTAITAAGDNKAIDVETAHCYFDDEPCIQLLTRATAASGVMSEEIAAQLQLIKDQDVATATFNRQYMITELDKLIGEDEELKRHCLLYIDLENFTANALAIFGQTGTDLALHSVANTIRTKIDETDVLSRFSDSTFMLLCCHTQTDAALAKAAQIVEAIETHIIEINHKTMQPQARIGVSVINENTATTNEAIERAQTACEKSTDKDKRVALFELEAGQRLIHNMGKTIARALEHNRFRLLFQPIVSLRGDAEEYYEAYVRMLDDDNIEVPPLEFLTTASEIGLITKIDRWVILESMKVLAQHRSTGHNTKLLVNISAESLCDAALVKWLKLALSTARLPTGALTLQVRETDVLTHLTAAKNFSEAIVTLGIHFSMSNFGKSAEPLNSLKHVHSEFIKIDGSFTRDIQTKNESPDALVKLIKALTAEQKVVLIPFLENSNLLSTLWQAGAHYIQGNYLQEPSRNMSFDFNMES